MAELLSHLWKMSLTAAYVTAVVAVLRLVLKRHVPRQVVCLLWLVVFARLLVPVSLPSPVSLVPNGQQVSQMLTPGEAVQMPLPDAPEGSASTPAVPEGGAAAPRAFPWREALSGVWLAGAVAVGGYGLISYLRLRRRLFDAVRTEDGAWEHPAVTSPFLLGMIRPRICLPPGLSGQPRQLILCHEQAHLRRLDHIVKPVCYVALALHWFNPAAWLAFLLMSRDMEAACDEAVLRRLGSGVKADYAQTLLAMAAGRRLPSPCPLAFGEGDAKSRIEHVLRYRRPALWIVVAGLAAAAVAAVCLFTDPMAAGSNGPAGSFRAVLTGEASFQYDAEDGSGSKTLYVSDIPALFYDDPYTMIDQLAVVDLNGDGQNEVVLRVIAVAGDMGGYLVLCQWDGAVEGFPLSYRSFEALKTDGTFFCSFSQAASGAWICSVDLEHRTVQALAYPVSLPNLDSVHGEHYYVDGQEATQEEYDAAVRRQEGKPDAVWYDFPADVSAVFP